MVPNEFILASINRMNFRIHTKRGNGLQALLIQPPLLPCLMTAVPEYIRIIEANKAASNGC